ncbi:hypothetical protein D9M68_595300 [compost metagenome]
MNSICRIWPTATSTDTSGQRAVRGTGPPSVPVTSNSWPWMWIGWLVIVRLPARMRTRSPRRTLSVSMAGNTRLLKLQMLKSVMVLTLGVALPGSTSKLPSRKQKSRSTFSISGCSAFGCVTQKPIIPIAICTISSACGWYMKVPGRRAVNS